jgi:hypothetical protein
MHKQATIPQLVGIGAGTGTASGVLTSGLETPTHKVPLALPPPQGKNFKTKQEVMCTAETMVLV